MILDEIAAHARERVEAAKRARPQAELERLAAAMPVGGAGGPPAFEAAVGKPGLSFICEVKRASPSKGLIAPDFPYLEITRDYEAAGADALSVLTEPKYFLGGDAYLQEIAAATRLPCLRKDFVVDPAYQVPEAKLLGASAVLLICALLAPQGRSGGMAAGGRTLRDAVALTHALGMSALVEAHDEAELDAALDAGARLVGVNNRDLRTFAVDTSNAARLRGKVPKGVLFVSESGIRSAEDAEAARAIGADAVLVGESLMRARDRRAFLAELRGGANNCEGQGG